MLTLQLALIFSICSGVLSMLRAGTSCPSSRMRSMRSSICAWQTLYLRPLPHQQGSLRPGRSASMFFIVTASVSHCKLN